ncbi:MAG: hypothetical protein M5U19_06580 [Microthrixaceae bacterium]|nr:hypothetical protein [Microthrixaceae bacterium]
MPSTMSPEVAAKKSHKLLKLIIVLGVIGGHPRDRQAADLRFRPGALRAVPLGRILRRRRLNRSGAEPGRVPLMGTNERSKVAMTPAEVRAYIERSRTATLRPSARTVVRISSPCGTR